jgi:hypothetical protein
MIGDDDDTLGGALTGQVEGEAVGRVELVESAYIPVDALTISPPC